MSSLRRSKNRMITGTAAGLAEYFGIDTTLVRVLFALFIVFGGSGLLAYLIIFLVMFLSENK